ncbi:MAG TPA: flavin reductase family protein [Gemmatimonadales bacterium]|nr:flavin reductase family protein [Gemmatimonadales bacterium]
METTPAYELLRIFASPLVAITSHWQGKSNGMISDAAIRASISPRVPRLSVYVHRWHLSHEYIWKSGRLTVHLLHQGQLELVHQLGFVSGRKQDKLADVPHRPGLEQVPLLADCYAAFECRVLNAMDTGYSTLFFGEVLATHRGTGETPLTAEWFRANMPAAWKADSDRNYREAQDYIDSHTAIASRPWPGPA